MGGDYGLDHSDQLRCLKALLQVCYGDDHNDFLHRIELELVAIVHAEGANYLTDIASTFIPINMLSTNN